MRYDRAGRVLVYSQLPAQYVRSELDEAFDEVFQIIATSELQNLYPYELLSRPTQEIWLALSEVPYPSSQTRIRVQQTGSPYIERRFPGEVYEWEVYGDAVLAATQVGVIRFEFDASRSEIRWERLSRFSATSVDVRRVASETEVAAVGGEIARWNPETNEFEALRFEATELATFRGVPIDVAIDKEGRWAILFRGGKLLLLDEEERFCRLLHRDNSCIVTTTAARLL